MLDQYFANLQAEGKSPKTISTYRLQLKKFFQWLSDNDQSIDYKDITSIDAVEYRAYLQEQGFKPASVNTALASIEAYCTWLVGEEFLTHNPLIKVKRVQQVQEAPKWLDKSEKYRLKRTVEQESDLRNRAIILTLLLAGLRATELVTLTPKDIELSERKGVITVRQGKGNKRRKVFITKDLRDCLQEYVGGRALNKWLFGSQRGEQLSYMGLYQLCQMIGRKAGIELTPHTLRHTFCHDLISKGVPIGDVAMLAGHAKLDTTLLYTRPGEHELQADVEKLSLY